MSPAQQITDERSPGVSADWRSANLALQPRLELLSEQRRGSDCAVPILLLMGRICRGSRRNQAEVRGMRAARPYWSWQVQISLLSFGVRLYTGSQIASQEIDRRTSELATRKT